MVKKLHVQPLGRLAQIADVLMVPFMHIYTWTLERPQRTHKWNNTKLSLRAVEHLHKKLMVYCAGDPESGSRFNPFFHSVFGWRNYVVIQPAEDEHRVWHVGWKAEDVIGVSRIPLTDAVRQLIGPGDVSFFGVDINGKQLALKTVARGRINDGGPYGNVPIF